MQNNNKYPKTRLVPKERGFERQRYLQPTLHNALQKDNFLFNISVKHKWALLKMACQLLKYQCEILPFPRAEGVLLFRRSYTSFSSYITAYQMTTRAQYILSTIQAVTSSKKLRMHDFKPYFYYNIA